MSVISIGMSPQLFRQITAHDHAAWEIVLNFQGSGYTIIGENRYEFQPGSIICQPPNMPHSKFSQEGFRDIYWLPTSFPLAAAANKNSPLIFQDDNEKSFEALLFMAHRAYHEKKNNYKLYVDSLIDALNQLLVGWQNQPQEDSAVEQLKKLLIESFTDPDFTISKLLDDSPYSNDHVRRRFKKATGQTPGEYLAELRMDYAKKLIAGNQTLHYSIAEIGMMSGYYDSHYFSRVFKKKNGMTPSEFMESDSDH